MVRSPHLAYDTFWQQAMNFHDPRIFYLSQTRGWTLGREEDDVHLLESWANKGAKYFADPVIEPSPALDAWLSTHAELVWAGSAGGRVGGNDGLSTRTLRAGLALRAGVVTLGSRRGEQLLSAVGGTLSR